MFVLHVCIDVLRVVVMHLLFPAEQRCSVLWPDKRETPASIIIYYE